MSGGQRSSGSLPSAASCFRLFGMRRKCASARNAVETPTGRGRSQGGLFPSIPPPSAGGLFAGVCSEKTPADGRSSPLELVKVRLADIIGFTWLLASSITAVVVEHGAVYVCGRGVNGQLGLNSYQHQLLPARVGVGRSF